MTIDDLIAFLYKPMTDDAVIEAVEVLGLSLPTEADYEDEDSDELYTSDDNNVGIVLAFKELEGFSDDTGDPLLTSISIENHCHLKLPHGIEFSDTYKQVVGKVGDTATYQNKFIKKMRIFPFNRKDGREYAIHIVFSDDELTVMSSFVIAKFATGSNKFLVNLKG